MVNGSLIVNNGRKILLHRGYIASPTITAPTEFKIGVLNSTPSITNTALDNQIPMAGTEQADACDATTGWNAGTDTVVALNTTAGQFKEGTGSLNFTKTGSTLATVEINKAVTSLDFTDKFLHFWLYVDATDVALATS